MKTRSKPAFLLAVAWSALVGHMAVAAEADDTTVVVVIVDGLSGAMIEAAETPSLDRIRGEGLWTHRFLPTFPSVSGPTWVSLSTGCWPEHHGVVTDKFVDPESA